MTALIVNPQPESLENKMLDLTPKACLGFDPRVYPIDVFCTPTSDGTVRVLFLNRSNTPCLVIGTIHEVREVLGFAGYQVTLNA